MAIKQEGYLFMMIKPVNSNLFTELLRQAQLRHHSLFSALNWYGLVFTTVGNDFKSSLPSPTISPNKLYHLDSTSMQWTTPVRFIILRCRRRDMELLGTEKGTRRKLQPADPSEQCLQGFLYWMIIIPNKSILIG